MSDSEDMDEYSNKKNIFYPQKKNKNKINYSNTNNKRISQQKMSNQRNNQKINKKKRKKEKRRKKKKKIINFRNLGNVSIKTQNIDFLNQNFTQPIDKNSSIVKYFFGNQKNYNHLSFYEIENIIEQNISSYVEGFSIDSYKKNNFIIYAAPNNGPYEVINFLNKNKKILQKEKMQN